MKKLFTIIITLIYSFLATSQEKEKTEEQISFDKATEYYNNDDNENALNSYTAFLSQYLNSSLIPRAKFNIGVLLRKLGRNDEAIPIFSEILDSDYDEKEAYGGIMEQYALYKNRSSKELAEIYFEKKDYKKVSHYIYLFDKKYKYHHFCGNEIRADKIYIAESYAKLFLGQNKPQKAIDKLLPYVFYDGLASNLGALEILEESLKMKYNEAEIKELITLAVKSLNIQNDYNATITFLGEKLKVAEEQLYDLSNPLLGDDLELKGNEKFNRIFAIHPLFSKYLK